MCGCTQPCALAGCVPRAPAPADYARCPRREGEIAASGAGAVGASQSQAAVTACPPAACEASRAECKDFIAAAYAEAWQALYSINRFVPLR